MEIIQTTLAALIPEQKAQLRLMTLPLDSSLMKSTLDTFGKIPSEDPNKVKIAIVDSLGKWIAWAMVRPWKFKQNLVMLFVLPEHRRRGIGKSLIKFLRDNNEFDCYPWDETSQHFFSAVRLRPYWLGA